MGELFMLRASRRTSVADPSSSPLLSFPPPPSGRSQEEDGRG